MKDVLTKGLPLIITTTFLSSIGQALLKYGALHPARFIFLNIWLWLGILLYGVGLMTLLIGIRKSDLSTLFPVLSLSFVWVMIISAIFFSEQITFTRVGGTALIVAGVAILSINNKK